MERSESIADLAAALAVAQGQFAPVLRGATNPTFKSKYATLDAVINAVKGPLSEAGLAYLQLIEQDKGGASLTTMLVHKSGQFISIAASVDRMSGNRATNDMQNLGSALTYMKRYQLSAMLGVNTDTDDDGNNSGKVGEKKAPPPQSESAKLAQAEKERIEASRQLVKAAWIKEAKRDGLLSDTPTSAEWAKLIELMGGTYKEVATVTKNFDVLRDAGLQLIEANALKPEPEAPDSDSDALLDERDEPEDNTPLVTDAYKNDLP